MMEKNALAISKAASGRPSHGPASIVRGRFGRIEGSAVFSPREATFDFPLYLSVVERRGGVGVLELVAWDQNILLKKEYLGEVALGVDGWFPRGEGGGDEKEWEKTLAWDALGNKVGCVFGVIFF